MYLENGRSLLQGITLVALSAIAYWVNLSIGLALIALMGILILQSAFTDWCPSDLFLRPMGLKKKRDSK